MAARRKQLQPPTVSEKQRASGLPGGGQGRVDLTGPADSYPDPNKDPTVWGDAAEGKPGYEESGRSEVKPPLPEGSAEQIGPRGLIRPIGSVKGGASDR